MNYFDPPLTSTNSFSLKLYSFEDGVHDVQQLSRKRQSLLQQGTEQR
jgi:hypothetical protein